MSEPEQIQQSLPKRLSKLGIGLAVLYVIVYVLAPLPIEHFGPMRQYVRGAEALGISPGSLYYTDVPVTADAEAFTRRAVRRYYKTAKDEKTGKDETPKAGESVPEVTPGEKSE